MQTPYTLAQKLGARKRTQNALSNRYANEDGLGIFVGSEEYKVAMEMSKEPGAQIIATKVEGKYQWFAPRQDTFTYKGFKWRKVNKLGIPIFTLPVPEKALFVERRDAREAFDFEIEEFHTQQLAQ